MSSDAASDTNHYSTPASSSTAGSDEVVAVPNCTTDKKKVRDNQNKSESRQLGMSFNEEDMVIDKGELISIKGHTVKQLNYECLRAFCRKLNMRVPTKFTKSDLIRELTNFKLLDKHRRAISDSVVGIEPFKVPGSLVNDEGSLFRAILTITDIDNRENYLGTTLAINRGELGTSDQHKDKWSALSYAYNDTSKYNTIGISSCSHGELYTTYNVSDNVSSSFDPLTADQFEQLVKHINAKFRVAKNKNLESGSHQDFHKYVGGNIWLLYYHERMQELGSDYSTQYMSIANPMLAEGVFSVSEGDQPQSELTERSSGSGNSGSGSRQLFKRRTKGGKQLGLEDAMLKEAKIDEIKAAKRKHEATISLLNEFEQLTKARKADDEMKRCDDALKKNDMLRKELMETELEVMSVKHKLTCPDISVQEKSMLQVKLTYMEEHLQSLKSRK